MSHAAPSVKGWIRSARGAEVDAVADPTDDLAPPDVTGTPLLDLLHSGDPTLAEAVQRLVQDVHDPGTVLSAFGNVSYTGRKDDDG